MKARVTIEYDLPPGNPIARHEREEERWMKSETVLTLPGLATINIEVLDAPLLPVSTEAA
jgi:hypothetical protein